MNCSATMAFRRGGKQSRLTEKFPKHVWMEHEEASIKSEQRMLGNAWHTKPNRQTNIVREQTQPNPRQPSAVDSFKVTSLQIDNQKCFFVREQNYKRVVF